MPASTETALTLLAGTDRCRDALLRVEAELRALPEDQLLPMNLNLMDAVDTGKGAWRKIHAPQSQPTPVAKRGNV